MHKGSFTTYAQGQLYYLCTRAALLFMHTSSFTTHAQGQLYYSCTREALLLKHKSSFTTYAQGQLHYLCTRDLLLMHKGSFTFGFSAFFTIGPENLQVESRLRDDIKCIFYPTKCTHNYTKETS
jgi:hypothetical protein